MGVVKLGDFGLASELEESCTKRQDVFGTSLYMAPEVYEEGAVLKSDVWSLGISLIEMGEGKNPYAGRSRMMIMKEVLTQPPPSLTLQMVFRIRGFRESVFGEGRGVSWFSGRVDGSEMSVLC